MEWEVGRLEVVSNSQGCFLWSLSWALRKCSIFTGKIILLIHGLAQKCDIQFSCQRAWCYGAHTLCVVLTQKQGAEGPTRRKV